MVDDDQQKQGGGLLSQIGQGLGKALPYALDIGLGAAMGGPVGAAAGLATGIGGAQKYGLKEQEADIKLERAESLNDLAAARTQLAQQGIDLNWFKAQDVAGLHQVQIQNLKSMEDMRVNANKIAQQKVALEAQMVGLKGQDLALAKQKLDSYNEQLSLIRDNFQRQAVYQSIVGGALLQRQDNPIGQMFGADDADQAILGNADDILGAMRSGLPEMSLPNSVVGGGGAAQSKKTLTAKPASSGAAASSIPKPPKSLWGKTVTVDGKAYKIDKMGNAKAL